MKKKNKFLTIIGSLVLAAALSSGIVACANSGKNGGAKAAASKDVYALSAIAGASYLTHVDDVTVRSAGNGSFVISSFASEKTATARPDEYTDESVTDIKNCLTMFESTLAGGISHTVGKNEETEGELAEYNFVMTVEINGASAKVYYNEVYTETETEIDEEDGTEEFEESTYLTGVIVYGDETFNVSGKREVEKEEDETEYSIEFITKKDDKNYVKVSYGTETETNEKETSYEYEIVVNGKKVTETELSFEEGSTSESAYNMPFGAFMVSVHTSSVRLNVEEEKIESKASYRLSINGEHCSDCDIQVTVQAKETFKLC